MNQCTRRVLVLLLVLCVVGQAIGQTTGRSLLWRISGNGLQKPSYLWGTIHLRDKQMFRFPDSLYHVLAQSDGFAMEIDPQEALRELVHNLTEPDTTALLRDVMKDADFKRIASDLEAQLSVPADKITRRQAWLYKQTRQTKLAPGVDGMDVEMDLYLYNLARRMGKVLVGVEDVPDQFGVLDSLGGSFDAAELLESAAREKGKLNQMKQLYLAEDLDGLLAFCRQHTSPAQLELLLGKRNFKMARRMDSLAFARSHFFAVGAAHLPGADGVIALLRKRGFRVEAVTSPRRITPDQYQVTGPEPAWQTVTNEDATFSLQLPGAPFDFPLAGTDMKMQLHADVGTGHTYFFFAVRLPSGGGLDAFARTFSANLGQGSKAAKFHSITYKGQPATELEQNAKGYYYRIRLVPNDDQVVILMLMSRQERQLQDSSASRFFNSLQLKGTRHLAAAAATKAWINYRDTLRGFALEFPVQPEQNKQLMRSLSEKDSTYWNIDNRMCVDQRNQVFYGVVVKNANPGYYITSDTVLFNEMLEGVASKMAIDIQSKMPIRYRNMTALRVDAKQKANNLQLRLLLVNRSNQNYMLLTVSDPALSDSADINRFFNSFEVYNPMERVWEIQQDGAGLFRMPAPAPLVRQGENKYSVVSYQRFQSNTLHVDVAPLSAFYWAASDSVFYADRIADYVDDEDSVLASYAVSNGGVPGREYLIRQGLEGRNLKRVRTWLNGDSTYVLHFTGLPEDVEAPAYKAAFEQFAFNHYRPNKDILRNKTKEVLDALRNGDSLRFAAAAEAIEKLPFTEADLPLLHEALLDPYRDFSSTSLCAHDNIIDRVVAFGRPETINFVREHYHALKKDKGILQYPLLRVLAGIYTEASYATLKELLLSGLPKEGSPAGMANQLYDSLDLALTLFPDIIPLASDSVFAPVVGTLCYNLLEAEATSLAELAPYRKDLLTHGKAALQRMLTTDDRQWLYNGWIQLLGRLNDATGNALLQQVAGAAGKYQRYLAVEQLLGNKATVPRAALEQLAADQYYRVNLYNLLLEKKRIDLFVPRYNNQKSIAESELYAFLTDEDREPDALIHEGVHQAMYRGKKQQFHVWRIRYEAEDGSTNDYLGVTGPYPLHAKTLLTDTRATGLSDQLFDPTKIATQLQQYLDGLGTDSAEE